MLSHDDSDRHPYWFARIIGLFHVVVHHSSSINPIELDVVWVRWYAGMAVIQTPNISWGGRAVFCQGLDLWSIQKMI